MEIVPEISSDAVPARVWQGVTEGGIKIQVLVTRIAVEEMADRSQFENELCETPAPTPDIPRVFPLRMIL